MQVINKKIVIFICLSIFIFGLFKLFNKEKTILDEVKLDIRDTNNSFAIYVEQNDGNYEESESKEFPKGYKYNYIKSNCTGIDGNIVSGVLDYNNETGIATVDTSDSLNCYLYFDKGAGLEIIGKGPNGLNLDINNSDENWTGMYRFQGQQSEGIENYICFGTSDQDECKANPNKYMYRIIGIEESGRIKVIKKEALDETDQWWTDDDTLKHWSESKVYTDINGDKFLNNKELIPNGWQDKIDTNHWLFGTMHSNNGLYGARQSGVEVYKIESGQKEAVWYEKANSLEDEYKGVKAQSSTTSSGAIYYYITHTEKWSDTILPHEVNAKIGLMNISDYYLSVSNTANCQIQESKYTECLNGWMHITQNDNNSPSKHELTMTRYGWNIIYGYFTISYVHSSGYTSVITSDSSISVRPVFYLKANNMLKEGSGTEEDPFVIEDVTYEGEPKGLIEFAPKGLNTTTTSNNEEWTGMYRYQGQQSDNIENYICFGTSDKEECLKNQDKYMYRIIGIEENGRIKVIKKDAMDKTYQWHTSELENITWPNSIPFKSLNGDDFLNNKELVPNGWEDKIDDNNWLYGDNRINSDVSYKTKAIDIYKYESGKEEIEWHILSTQTNPNTKLFNYSNGNSVYYEEINEKWQSTINAKIGLIYKSDFSLALGIDGNCIANSCQNSWMYLAQNDGNPPSPHEWTMTRVGLTLAASTEREYYSAYDILNTGKIGTWHLKGTPSIRPVFFLKNNIKIIDGNGKSDNPFIINL